jgi:hypothetical protein
LGRLKKEREREKAPPPVLQMLSAWRNGGKSSRQPYIGLRLMSPMGKMMYEPVPRQLFQKLNLHGTQMKQKAETIYIDIERL